MALVNRQLSEQGRPAGFVSRLVAVTIDLALLVAFITVVTLVGQWLVSLLALSHASKVLVAAITAGIAFLVYVVYFVALIAAGGQTVGKRIMGLRVVRTDGGPVSGWRSLKRFVGYILALPLFWGYLMVLVDNRRQAFQDHFADTYVIYFMPGDGELGPLEQHLQAVLMKRRARIEARRAAIKEQEQLTGEPAAPQPPQAAKPSA